MRKKLQKFAWLALCSAALILDAGGTVQAADAVKVAVLRFVSSGPIFIAQEKGYFAAEGLDVTFKFFDAAQPVAVAIASGDADFGATGFTAGLFNIAAKGAFEDHRCAVLRGERVEGSAILASQKAFGAGLVDAGKLEGRSFGLTQTGSSFHYMIGRVTAASGVDLSAIVLKPLQSVGNVVGALKPTRSMLRSCHRSLRGRWLRRRRENHRVGRRYPRPIK